MQFIVGFVNGDCIVNGNLYLFTIYIYSYL